jgi:hypothetical protein
MNPQLPRKRRTLPTQAARFEEMNERCARIILSDRRRYPKTSSPSQLATPDARRRESREKGLERIALSRVPFPAGGYTL